MSQHIISLSGHNTLAHSIAQHYNTVLHTLTVSYFPDGEICFNADEFKHYKDSRVVLVHSLGWPVQENIFAVLLAVDRLKKEGVQYITLVAPYLSYARQCQPINHHSGSIELLIKCLEVAGVDEFVCIELHKSSIAKIFSRPIHNVTTEKILAQHIQDTITHYSDYCVVAPDQGAAMRAEHIARALNLEVIVASKRRMLNEKMHINLDQLITKKKAIIIDDMISTGQTLLELIDCLAKRGITSGVVYAIHPVFSLNALDKLLALPFFEKIIVCNTLPVVTNDSRVEFLDCTSLIVDALSTNRILYEHTAANKSGYQSHNWLG